MNSANEFYIVNNNGEVVKTVEDVNRIVELGVGDRIVRGNSKKLLTTTQKVKYRFSKTNDEYFGDICEKVPLVGKLLPFIHYSSCLLIYANNVYVTPRNFAMTMGISLSTSRRTFKKLEQLQVIKKIKVANNKYAYYFNPYIVCKGVRIETETLDMFCKSIYRE